MNEKEIAARFASQSLEYSGPVPTEDGRYRHTFTAPVSRLYQFGGAEPVLVAHETLEHRAWLAVGHLGPDAVSRLVTAAVERARREPYTALVALDTLIHEGWTDHPPLTESVK